MSETIDRSSGLAAVIRVHQTPPAQLTLWWLGQAGFIIKSPAGHVIALDPYLTNSCKAVGESFNFNMDRLVPPPLSASDLRLIDLYVLTHSHQDHLDPDTLAGYRAAGGAGPYLAPAETLEKLRELGVPDSQLEMTWPNRVRRLGDVALRSTFAIPLGGDDLTHVGYLVTVDDGPTIYFTGDTGYHDLIPAAVKPHRPDVLVTVINGIFRNLTPAEAAKLARELDVKTVIPCHHDLFPDNIQPPNMLHSALKIEGIGERYRELRHGKGWTCGRVV